MAEYFHHLMKWSDKEVVSTELPGELWVKLFDTENPQALYEVSPGANPAHTTTESAPIISVSEFMGVYHRKPQDARCQCLMPYIRDAMDLGYEYLMLTR